MSERVFLRGISSDKYGLGERRELQLSAPRVRHEGEGLVLRHGVTPGYSRMGSASTAEWFVGPGDDPFLTQSLQVHSVDLDPGGQNDGHAHQNEALLYVLEGRGYEVHDGTRYEWEAGDAVIVHTDSVHQHFNAERDKPARGVIFKAKAAWLYLGMWQQGRSAPFEQPGYGPREDWSRVWTKGVEQKRKVVKHDKTRWENTRDGRVRVITSPSSTDVRFSSVDLYEQEIPPGGRSAKHLHMADEILFIESGRGDSNHWRVEAEIADKYYARVATEPTTWSFATRDVVYVPHNTFHQHVNTGDTPLRFLCAQNRLFKLLGYDNVVYLEDARS